MPVILKKYDRCLGFDGNFHFKINCGKIFINDRGDEK